ncbi:hypothetical protein TNCV_1026711 [Trichonephila clavipes]|nr:hypothetical protein TNCV_1026711 [Trichonephila clavipes]
MSYHKYTRKEDFINVLKAIGKQATSKEIIIHLKNKLEKSAAFKDDPDFVMKLLNLSVEDRQTKSEQQLQVINSQLQFEKIKLKQIEREIELQKALTKGQATQQSSKGDTNNLENLIKSVKRMKSEDKDTDVMVDDTPLSATLDSGANSVIINSKYVSEEKRIHSQIVLTSCFGEKRKTNISEFTISLKGGEEQKILAALCEIKAVILLPSKVFEFLRSESEEAGPTDASCNSVCLQNETEGENPVGVSVSVANSEKQTDKWLEQGIIRENCSDFSSPVVVCKKKDEAMRMGIDYRKLNKIIKGAGKEATSELTKGREFSERTLDAEVDDPRLKKQRREQWPSRNQPPVVNERDA